jgi:hypothetical protein
VDDSEVVAQLDSLMQEAIELRSLAKMPHRTDQADEILDRLYECRQALDRLEEIMRTVNRLKYLAQRQKATFEAVADDAWATSLSKIRQIPSFKGDYVGPREKYAEADLSTMEQRRRHRQAEELLSHVSEVNEFVRTCYFGLNGVRDDIKSLIRTLSNDV